jgi:CheY-like chemotaxis protein
VPGVASRGRVPDQKPTVGDIRGLNVLCIDNEIDVLNGMQSLLDGWGCRSAMATSRGEALQRIETMSGLPSVILADYHLHGGTGVEAVQAIFASAGRSLPVVIITADHSPEVQREVREQGFIILRKPLKAAQLRAILARISTQSRIAAE